MSIELQIQIQRSKDGAEYSKNHSMGGNKGQLTVRLGNAEAKTNTGAESHRFSLKQHFELSCIALTASIKSTRSRRQGDV